MNKEPVIFLSCTFDSRASFYNKAYYTREGNIINLYSYNTLVLKYDIDKHQFIDIDFFPHSMTTSRHIREFKRQIEARLIA